MPIESASFVSQLTSTNPVAGDNYSDTDDHLRMIKACIRATWPNMTAIACTPTTVEFNYLTGLTGPIQTQFSGKASLTGATFSGVVQVGTFSNAFLSLGINLNQAANTNEILALASTSVAHGFTTEANTATFGSFKKYDASGGTRLNGFSGASVGVDLIGNVVTEQSTRSTLALGAVMLSGKKQLTGAAVTMSANQNVVCITDGTSTRFIFDSDGDSHQDVGTAWTNYDHLDDVGTLDALAYNVARSDDPIKKVWRVDEGAPGRSHGAKAGEVQR